VELSEFGVHEPGAGEAVDVAATFGFEICVRLFGGEIGICDMKYIGM
jgi:hypothetical protein